MIYSMTGYGKGEALLPQGKLTVEIRSLNGKSADIGVKSPLLPKDRDLAVRQQIAQRLGRGTIDLFLSFGPQSGEEPRLIDKDLLVRYFNQVKEAAGEAKIPLYTRADPTSSAVLLNALLRYPDVAQTRAAGTIDEAAWPAVEKAIGQALDAVVAWRAREGRVLYADVTARIRNILDLSEQVEALEGERIEAVKARLTAALEALGQKPDPQRFEQELIYYIEKLDMNEERVRLRENCRHFLETIDGESAPGKKLGFIIQEIGREINTTGSKANHAGIQRIVVRMKDELEKMREQCMNIL